VKVVVAGISIVIAIFVLACVAALVLVASPLPPLPPQTDVFDFASLGSGRPATDLPTLRRYPARDGEELAYRYYDSAAERILIFVHGSSYHGAGYHALASFISSSGAARVVLPNLRGHYQSGHRRGDVDYIGQFEDDLVDLIKFLRAEGRDGPITLGGHSSGGGFVLRFAGGGHGVVTSFLALAPAIPTSPAMRFGTAGGWANLHMRRLYGLIALNTIGIHGFDGLPVVQFNKPAKYWDGTETLAYSYRLNVSYHPGWRYQGDVRALGDNALVLVGTEDQAIDAQALRAIVERDAPRARMVVLPQVNHFGVFGDPKALEMIAAWLRALPAK
jgi:non-heme chloroperoxidase